MEVFYAREGERAACMTFLRDHITRVADKSSLQRAQIETILSDRVRKSPSIFLCYKVRKWSDQ